MIFVVDSRQKIDPSNWGKYISEESEMPPNYHEPVAFTLWILMSLYAGLIIDLAQSNNFTSHPCAFDNASSFVLSSWFLILKSAR